MSLRPSFQVPASAAVRTILAAAGLVAAMALLAPRAAEAQSAFPTRLGESGLLDIPDGEALPLGSARLGGELRFDKTPGNPGGLGPLPLAVEIGLGTGIEGGFALRQGGFPGDPRPSPTLFTSALKFQFQEASGLRPALAVDAVVDRFNAQGRSALRLLASTAAVGRLRFAAFAGVESAMQRLDAGAVAGLAVSSTFRRDFQAVLEGLAGPRGPLLGAAFRWEATARTGLSLGVSWLPRDEGIRFSLGIGLIQSPHRRGRAAPAPIEAPEPPPPSGPQFLDDRPHFRMRMASITPPGAEAAARRQPYTQPVDSHPGLRPPPSPGGTAEEQREKELLARADELDSRERRLLSADAAFGNRGERLLAEQRRSEKREQSLAARAATLDARDRKNRSHAPAAGKESQLADLEEKLRVAEADLASQERAARDQAEQAERRERTARTRETEAQAATTSAPMGGDRGARLEFLERQLATRDGWLAALEERVSATRERLEQLEAATRLHGERLDSASRRLAAREERLALVERRTGQVPAPAAGDVAASGGSAVTLLVRPPTSIVRPAGGAGGPAPTGEERSTVAAAVAALGAGGAMQDTEREAILSVAREAARGGDEVLVWARAQNPGLIEEAARRAEEIKGMVAAEGVPPARIGTRATLRPSGKGIDVVVSAQRAAQPEVPSSVLQPGETGKRQVREAVLQARPDIEFCARGELLRRGLSRAEIQLRLSVSAGGKVTRATAAPPFSGGELDSCLAEASRAWSFPGGEGGYTSEVPVTVLGEGGTP